jgi:hypothetical protein
MSSLSEQFGSLCKIDCTPSQLSYFGWLCTVGRIRCLVFDSEPGRLAADNDSGLSDAAIRIKKPSTAANWGRIFIG